MADPDEGNTSRTSWFAPWHWDGERWIGIVSGGILLLLSLVIVDVVLMKYDHQPWVGIMTDVALTTQIRLLSWLLPLRSLVP